MTNFILNSDSLNRNTYASIIYSYKKMQMYTCLNCKNEYCCVDSFQLNEIRCPYCKENKKENKNELNNIYKRLRKLENTLKIKN